MKQEDCYIKGYQKIKEQNNMIDQEAVFMYKLCPHIHQFYIYL